MLKRIITSIVAVIVLIPFLIFSNTWLFPIGISLCAFLGCYEMLSCVGKQKNIFLALPISLAALFFPLAVRYTYINAIQFGDLLKLSLGIALVAALYVFAIAVFDNKKTAVTDAALIYMSCLYIIAAFSAIVYLHDYIQLGNMIYLLAFICAWTTDIFAYFTGRFLGRHKLIESVSPKKTVEGLIGGVIGAMAGVAIYALVLDLAFGFTVNYLLALLYGFVGSFGAVFGDLCFSVIKRQTGIKDYGNLIPGHGGVLDRFDSMMIVGPLAEALILLIPVAVKVW